jgi:hypothetical protein
VEPQVGKRYLERLALQRGTPEQWDEVRGKPAEIQRLLNSIMAAIKAEMSPRHNPAPPTERELWRRAGLRAVQRFCAKHKTSVFERQALIIEELDRIVAETLSRGATPSPTLSRALQELQPTILFLGRGKYEYQGER